MIYLDYQATTPLAPEAAAAMRPWIETAFGNPHSPHRIGREAAAAIEVARERVATAFGEGTEAGRVIFTSGATEAINWALKGIMEKVPPSRSKVVTIATEHAAVLDTVKWLGSRGFETLILPVDRDGLVDWRVAEEAVDDRTALVAMMYVNNEIGVINHTALMHFSNRAREVGALVLCDAVQGYGRLPIPLRLVDLAAISGHKVHGPKGIGALWVRKGCEPAPLLHGGGQEGALRSGTLSPALCVGFGEAAALAAARMQQDFQYIHSLAERLREPFRAAGWHINGSRGSRWWGNLNLRREGVDAARLISELREIAFSAGSACASGSGRPSHVLKAIGLSDAEARSSIRLGIGRYTTEQEIDRAAELILEAAARQRSFAA